MGFLDLKPNPDNPRTITKSKFERLKGKIERNPDGLSANNIVHKDGVIIAGNQRWRALQELGIEPKNEWFKDVSGWTKDQIDEYLINSNESDGEWDWDIMTNKFSHLPIEDWIDVPSDWKQEEIVEDEAPPVADVAVSKLGEIYQLGRHRLMCGDSTYGEQVSRLMNGVQANMVHTDPPYNVNYKSRSGNGYAEGKYEHLKAFDDNKTPEDFQQFLFDVAQNIHDNTRNNAAIYVWHHDGGYRAEPFYNMFKHCGWTRDSSIIWVKNNASMGWQLYRQQHETLSYGWKSGKVYQTKARDLTSTWKVSKDANQTYQHPTQKPIELCAMPLQNSSRKGDIILDLFLGSGSTLIAAEQTDRICYGMELDPHYCDVIRKRYWKFINNNDEIGWIENTPVITERAPINV